MLDLGGLDFLAPDDPEPGPGRIRTAALGIDWFLRRGRQGRRLPGQHGQDDVVRLRCAAFHDFGDAGGVVGDPAYLGSIEARP